MTNAAVVIGAFAVLVFCAVLVGLVMLVSAIDDIGEIFDPWQ
ncbi:hypothetical protein [Thalassospira alkalitolerans]